MDEVTPERERPVDRVRDRGPIAGRDLEEREEVAPVDGDRNIDVLRRVRRKKLWILCFGQFFIYFLSILQEQ